MPVENKDAEIIYSDFGDMEFIPDELLISIDDYGMKYPSDVQSRTIHVLHSGRDMIVQAEAGTGKTGAFIIGALTRIEAKKIHPQVIVVANTQPLATQISIVANELGKSMNIVTCLCVGQQNTSEKNAALARKSHILVGTPGRLCDLSNRGVYQRDDIKIIIMDEADELLNRDFVEDIRFLVTSVNREAQICTFSATYSDTSRDLAQFKITRDPFMINIISEKPSLDRIRQYQVSIKRSECERDEIISEQKIIVLLELVSALVVSQMIVFVNRIQAANAIEKELLEEGFQAVGVVSSGGSVVDRENTLKRFRLGQIKILISTDITARGIDIDDLRCVINFDFPNSVDKYVHRIGRAGRFGGQGVAISFVQSDREREMLGMLVDVHGMDIESMPVIDNVSRLLTTFEPPKGKASSSRNYK